MAKKTQVITTEKPAMMSSKEIAKLTGKSKSDIHVDIWNMLKQLYSIGKDDGNFHHHKNHNVTVTEGVVACFDNRGYVSEFLLDRRHTEILITGYDVVRRAAVIDRWFKLESGAGRPAVECDWRNNPAQLRNILIGFTEQVEQVNGAGAVAGGCAGLAVQRQLWLD